MTHDIAQTNEYNEAVMEMNGGESYQTSEPPLLPAASSTTDSVNETLSSFQTQLTNFFANVSRSTATFFRENRQLLGTLGWIFLAFLGIRILFASLDAIDDLPLMSSFLNLIGLVALGQFAWRHLIRASDRQELSQKIDQAKADLLGN